ncbi:hypothetical protein F5X68DRAFT_2483 [Plectosphaerella plurivora]|uniref:Uncharacterized protein n=1 Tax=Plectosphaerella plurivora TaxID=936078 RepID=A0A9P9AGD3_9PEZI|nr:hypothetical protein F5X68DRAFT_2483 [Plectosphaerella plurivora]
MVFVQQIRRSGMGSRTRTLLRALGSSSLFLRFIPPWAARGQGKKRDDRPLTPAVAAATAWVLEPHRPVQTSWSRDLQRPGTNKRHPGGQNYDGNSWVLQVKVRRALSRYFVRLCVKRANVPPTPYSSPQRPSVHSALRNEARGRRPGARAPFSARISLWRSLPPFFC